MKCFYHNDLDGRCAGSIVAKVTQNYNKEDYFEVDYTQLLPLDKIEEGETVYFVDYSFKENTVWQLETLINDKNCNVIWIDHHTSSMNLEKTKGYEWVYLIKGIRKEGISGAALTYMYFYDCQLQDCPYYIQLVSDYDCWKYTLEPYTTYFKLGIETVDFDALDDIWSDFDVQENILIKKGKVIKEYIDKDNDMYRKNYSYETEVDGYKCLVVNKKTNSWVFGEEYYNYPLVMVWVFNGDVYSYSLYSNDPTVDCSKIAERLGGGGHKGAAGFSSNELLFKKI